MSDHLQLLIATVNFLPQDEHHLKPHATHTGPKARQHQGDTSMETGTGCHLLPWCRRRHQAKPSQLLGDPRGWGRGRAAAAQRELLSAQGWGTHATCTSMIINTACCCSSTTCKANTWKKCPTTFPLTNKNPTSNPPNTCCHCSALNKAVRNTWVQCSGLFLLHSSKHNSPGVVCVPCPRQRTERGGKEPVWEHHHQAAQGLCFTPEEDGAAAQPGTSTGTCSPEVATGKMLLAEANGDNFTSPNAS